MPEKQREGEDEGAREGGQGKDTNPTKPEPGPEAETQRREAAPAERTEETTRVSPLRAQPTPTRDRSARPRA